MDDVPRSLCTYAVLHVILLGRFASPATVSRMGMIFLSDEDVDVARIVKCWLVHQPADQQLTLGRVVSPLSPPTTGCAQPFPPYVLYLCSLSTVRGGWLRDTS